MRAAWASASSPSMSLTTTVAPASASVCAMAAPMPRPAPVTIATLPSTRMSAPMRPTYGVLASRKSRIRIVSDTLSTSLLRSQSCQTYSTPTQPR